MHIEEPRQQLDHTLRETVGFFLVSVPWSSYHQFCLKNQRGWAIDGDPAKVVSEWHRFGGRAGMGISGCCFERCWRALDGTGRLNGRKTFVCVIVRVS